MVKGEFGNRKKVAPTIRRESNVGRGENRKEVVLPCAKGGTHWNLIGGLEA